jgi:hypothetical protein
MFDDETGSVWSHLDGRALTGPLAGEQLRVLPLQSTTWSAWLAEHPDSSTPDLQDTALAWVAGYEEATGRPFEDRLALGSDELGSSFRDSLDEIDPRLPANQLVIGALAGNEARAFPIEIALGRAPIHDTLGGVPIVILEHADGSPSLAYHRLLSDGRVLTFARRDGGLYDVETGSRWSPSGLAIEGAFSGVQLSFVISFVSEWYGWAAFNPTTSIYERGE